MGCVQSMKHKAIKVIIFDMGGVLIKTIDRHPRTELAKHFNMTYNELDALVYGSESAQKASLGEITETEHFEFVLNTLGSPDFGINRFQEAFWGGDVLDEELVAFISNHKDNFRFGMLSNAMSDIRKWLNHKYDFLRLFDVTFFSAEQKIAKPDPKFYFAILKEFNAEPHEAIFIDDFIENIAAAKNMGIHTIHYQNTRQTCIEINDILKD